MSDVVYSELIEKLIGSMKDRKKKVTDVSRETGIPKDRIYKWIQQGNRPKTEDEKAITKWLNGESSTIPFIEEPGISQTISLYQNDRIKKLEEDQAKYIKKLEDDNDRLWGLVKDTQEIIKNNLTLVLSTVRTISVRQEATGGVVLESLARLEKKPEKSLVVAGDKKRDQIEREAHKHGSAAAMGK